MFIKMNRRGMNKNKAAVRQTAIRTAAFESLEGRMLMSSVVVNSISDTDSAGTVTLRDAINMADSSQTPTTITFDPTTFATAQTILLDGAELELSNTAEPTTITGPTAGVTVSGNNQSRIFLVDPSVSLNLSSVSVTEGNAGSSFYGGGIQVQKGTLTISDCSVTNSTSLRGGGIYDLEGSVTATDVMISDNTATQFGGGIDSGDAGTNGATYDSSTGTVKLTGCTVAGNTALTGGGLANYYGTDMVIDSTIANNSSGDDTQIPANNGGGIFDWDGPLFVQESTIAGNSTSSAAGGGISLEYGGTVSISNSIVTSNSSTQDASDDVFGTVTSLGHNLVGKADGSSGWTSTDLTGTAATPLNADLGSLAYNGGPTQTMLPAANSPAISSGSVALIPSGITTDQRGDPRTLNGTVDIGAVEVGGTRVITNTVASVTTFAVSATTISAGGALTLTSSVSSASGSGPTATGNITFVATAAGRSASQTVALAADGTVTLQLPTAQLPNLAAVWSISANYSGDANYAASDSAAITVTILPASTVVGRVNNPKIPSHAIGGQTFVTHVPIVYTNKGPTLGGDFSAILYLAASVTNSAGGLTANPIELLSTLKKSILKYGRSLAVNFATHLLPTSVLAGNYNLVAKITDPLGNVDIFPLNQEIVVSNPLIALSVTAAAVKPATIAVGKSGSVVITVTNTGNINAAGSLVINLSPSSDGATPVAGITLATTTVHANIKPGKTAKFTVHFKVPSGVITGMYFPYAVANLGEVSATAIGADQFAVK